MSLMCPMEGCKKNKGPCGHEKGMLIMVLLLVVVFIVIKLI